MTIAAAYLTSEGVVLGADSTTSIVSGGGVVQLLNHAQKVFEVGRRGRMAVCTWGAGSVGSLSHRTIAARLADAVDERRLTVADATEELRNLVRAELLASNKTPFGGCNYFIGGWDLNTHTPACFTLQCRDAETSDVQSMSPGLCSFAGAPEFFARIFQGYAPELPETLRAALAEAWPERPVDFDQRFAAAFDRVAKNLISVGARDMPIREAIDYVYTFLHVTIKAFKFRYGPPVCGGPIEIGFVTTDRAFRWASHKGFGTAIAEHGRRHGDVDLRR